MKITIKLHNQDYLEAIRRQTGMNSHAEALNFLLTTLKMDGFSLVKGEKYIPVVNEEIVPAPMKEIVVEKKSTMFDEYQIDPTIQRLINAGLEMEF